MELSKSFIHKLVFQLTKFGIVGICATAIHVGVFTLAVEMNWATPLVANVIAFIPAFIFSFFNHYMWTFQCKERERSYVIKTMTKFLGVALFGVCMNSFGVYLITDILNLEYYYSILYFVFVTPIALFVLNKLLVFK